MKRRRGIDGFEASRQRSIAHDFPKCAGSGAGWRPVFNVHDLWSTQLQIAKGECCLPAESCEYGHQLMPRQLTRQQRIGNAREPVDDIAHGKLDTGIDEDGTVDVGHGGEFRRRTRTAAGQLLPSVTIHNR